MMKSLKAILKRDKEKYRVPRTVQKTIPIKRIWSDGIFQVGNNYSKTWKFSDINYLVASREDKESMFLSYSALLNSLDSGATTKLTINNHRMRNSAWRQFRKRNAYPTAITQNVEYLLDSVQARTMLSNSEFVVMFNQAANVLH